MVITLGLLPLEHRACLVKHWYLHCVVWFLFLFYVCMLFKNYTLPQARCRNKCFPEHQVFTASCTALPTSELCLSLLALPAPRKMRKTFVVSFEAWVRACLKLCTSIFVKEQALFSNIWKTTLRCHSRIMTAHCSQIWTFMNSTPAGFFLWSSPRENIRRQQGGVRYRNVAGALRYFSMMAAEHSWREYQRSPIRKLQGKIHRANHFYWGFCIVLIWIA